MKTFKQYLEEDKASDFGVAKAIKKTLDAGRQVKINDKPITKDDWDQDSANPERESSPAPMKQKPAPVRQKQSAPLKLLRQKPKTSIRKWLGF